MFVASARPCSPSADDVPTYATRNLYFIKKNADGMWVSGTLISDGSAFIISMVEDNNVSGGHTTQDAQVLEGRVGPFESFANVR